MQDGHGFASSIERVNQSYMGPGSYDSTPSYLGSVLVSPTMSNKTYRQHVQKDLIHGGSGGEMEVSRLMTSRAQARLSTAPCTSPSQSLGSYSPQSVATALSPLPSTLKKSLPSIGQPQRPGTCARNNTGSGGNRYNDKSLPSYVLEVQQLPMYKT